VQVLNFLRDGWCALPTTAEERKELAQEARFYQVGVEQGRKPAGPGPTPTGWDSSLFCGAELTVHLAGGARGAYPEGFSSQCVIQGAL
jgi:hypothetical protein